MQTFAAYTAARAAADRIVRQLAKGSQAAALTATQSRDALAAFERLNGFYTSTGRRVSLLSAVSEFAEAAGKLGGRTLGEAVEGYLRTVADVKRKDIKEAVEEFLQAAATLTKVMARAFRGAAGPLVGRSLPARGKRPAAEQARWRFLASKHHLATGFIQ